MPSITDTEVVVYVGNNMAKCPPDTERTGMIIPVSKETFFNTKWKSPAAQLSAYDMLFHPPDYNPKAARSDQTEPKIIRQNIWDQTAIDCIRQTRLWESTVPPAFNPNEYAKPISSTNHFMYGRPYWKPYDLPNKQHVRIYTRNGRGDMHIADCLQWATLVEEGKPDICNQ